MHTALRGLAHSVGLCREKNRCVSASAPTSSREGKVVCTDSGGRSSPVVHVDRASLPVGVPRGPRVRRARVHQHRRAAWADAVDGLAPQHRLQRRVGAFALIPSFQRLLRELRRGSLAAGLPDGVVRNRVDVLGVALHRLLAVDALGNQREGMTLGIASVEIPDQREVFKTQRVVGVVVSDGVVLSAAGRQSRGAGVGGGEGAPGASSARGRARRPSWRPQWPPRGTARAP